MRQAPGRGAPRPAKPHGCRHFAALDPARGPAERRSRPAGPAQVDASWASIGARFTPKRRGDPNFGDALTAVPLGIAFALRSQVAERRAGLAVVAAIFISACVAGVEAV